MGSDVSHADLVWLAERHLRGTRRCPIVLSERGDGEVVDAIGWDWNGHSIMVECKTSMADYYADAKKPRTEGPEFGVGRQRFYLTPKGMLKKEQLRESWGLLEAWGSRVRTIVPAPERESYGYLAEQRILRNEVLRWHLALVRAPDIDAQHPSHDLENANLLRLAHERCPRCKLPTWEWRAILMDTALAGKEE